MSGELPEDGLGPNEEDDDKAVDVVEKELRELERKPSLALAMALLSLGAKFFDVENPHDRMHRISRGGAERCVISRSILDAFQRPAMGAERLGERLRDFLRVGAPAGCSERLSPA